MSTSYTISVAPTNRAKCGTGKSQHPIQQGTLRFGSSYEKEGENHQITRYKCLVCSTGKVIKKAIDQASGEPSEIPGFSDLLEKEKEIALSIIQARITGLSLSDDQMNYRRQMPAPKGRGKKRPAEESVELMETPAA